MTIIGFTCGVIIMPLGEVVQGMSLAERTREAVQANPFLQEALAAGVVNYTAAARYLDVGDEEAVAAALRRYGEELDGETRDHDARVTMQSGLGQTDDPGEVLLTLDGTTLAADAGSLTGILATGEVSAATLGQVLGRCETNDIDVHGAAFFRGTLLVVVARREGPATLELVEAVCSD